MLSEADDRAKATFPDLANLADSPAVPFVKQFVKRGKHLWCLKCDSMARFLPHRCEVKHG